MATSVFASRYLVYYCKIRVFLEEIQYIDGLLNFIDKVLQDLWPVSFQVVGDYCMWIYWKTVTVLYTMVFCIFFTGLYDTAPEHFSVRVNGHAKSFLIVGTGFWSKTIMAPSF